ncbi:MAG: hypothetical protein IJJ33_07575 [Victivallales bacterium]|nr:hypothetical protein [Victivallales bacterium]
MTRPDIGTFEHAAWTTLPVAALVLGSALGWGAADRKDREDAGVALDDLAARQGEVYDSLLKERAKVAKGTASAKGVARALRKADELSGDMSKNAAARGPMTPITGALILMACALGVGSAVGSYGYFSKANRDNMKLEAIRKGLADYTKTRSGMTPVASVPKGSDEFFKEIDEGDGAQARDAPQGEPGHAASKRLRMTPEVAASRRGISVSL